MLVHTSHADKSKNKPVTKGTLALYGLTKNASPCFLKRPRIFQERPLSICSDSKTLPDNFKHSGHLAFEISEWWTFLSSLAVFQHPLNWCLGLLKKSQVTWRSTVRHPPLQLHSGKILGKIPVWASKVTSQRWTYSMCMSCHHLAIGRNFQPLLGF